MSISLMPAPVRTFFRAMEAYDLRTVLATLSPHATLVAEKRLYSGSEVESLLRQSVLPGQQLKALNGYERAGEHVLTVRYGTDFERIVNWHFLLDDNCIGHIEFSEVNIEQLPDPARSFIEASNAGDLQALLSTFADDALVNDQLFDHWGKVKISRWAKEEIVGQKLGIHVINVLKHYEEVIVTACVDGAFEKKGLPDPLVLAFYFSFSAEKIVQLIILRNHLPT